jgi:hypothetical protein
MKYPLANDLSGNPIEVPDHTQGWRVRRQPVGVGRPQNVYDPETGRQLEVALDVTLEDLRQSGCAPGRYRLEAIDGEGKAIPGIVAFTELLFEDEPSANVAAIAEPIARLLDTVEKQSDTICRALEAMAHAFGPVRPAGPVVVEQPVAPAEGVNTEKLMETVVPVVKMLTNAFKNGMAQGGGGTS